MPNIVIPLKLDHIYPHFKQILGELLPKAVLAIGGVGAPEKLRSYPKILKFNVSLFLLLARFAKISQLLLKNWENFL